MQLAPSSDALRTGRVFFETARQIAGQVFSHCSCCSAEAHITPHARIAVGTELNDRSSSSVCHKQTENYGYVQRRRDPGDCSYAGTMRRQGAYTRRDWAASNAVMAWVGWMGSRASLETRQASLERRQVEWPGNRLDGKPGKFGDKAGRLGGKAGRFNGKAGKFGRMPQNLCTTVGWHARWVAGGSTEVEARRERPWWQAALASEHW
eukprot:356357-Chlamydomonas_euryale.AAC.5